MRRLLPFVCVVVVIDTMLYAALTPLLPHFQRAYDLSKGGVGALAAAFAIGTLVAAIPGGVIATRLGARFAVVAGLTLVTLASVGVALADSFALLFGARFVQGLGSSITWTGALAWLALSTPRERRGATLGTAMGAAVFGALLGPVIGAGASAIGVRTAFSTVAGLCVVLIALAFAFEPAAPERQPARAILPALRTGEFLRGVWVITLPSLLFGTLIVLATLALADHGFSAVQIGAVWIGATAIETAVHPVLGRVADRRGSAGPIRLALIASIAVSLALATTEKPWVLVPLVLVSAIAFGGFYAPGLTMLSHAAERIGLAQALTFGVMNAAWAVGNAIGPAAGGGLAQLTSDAVPYLVCAGLCAATLAVFGGSLTLAAMRRGFRRRPPSSADTPRSG
jgi:MFS family permease